MEKRHQASKHGLAKFSFLVPALCGLLLMATVGISLYGNQIYNAIDSRQPKSSAELPVYLYTLNGGPQATLKEPMGVAVDKAGNIFIADTGNGRIQVFSPSGKFSRTFGSKGTGEGQFNYPYGLAFLDNGNLLIADSGNMKLLEFTPRGKFVRNLDLGKDKLRPGYAVRSLEGLIYISDLGGQEVLVLDGQGRLEKTISGLSTGFTFPQGLAPTAGGNLWLSDSGNTRVEYIGTQGQIVKVLNGVSDDLFTMVRGLALDNCNRLFVSDTMANQVRVFDSDQHQLFVLKEGRPGDKISAPTSITIDNWGRIFVADRGHNRIMVWGYKEN